MLKVKSVCGVVITSVICFTILISSSINGYCEEKELYAPGEVIVKLREKEDPQLLFMQGYSERKIKLTNGLLRLKSRYNLIDEIPVFETLHKELEEGNLTLQEMEERFRAKFSRRRFPKKREPVDLLPIYLLRTDQNVLELCKKLNKDPEVEYAQPNYIYKAIYTPNDPRYNELWGIIKIQASDAWDITEGLGAVVCINDTGVDYNHEDLRANIWSDADGKHGYDFVNNDSDPMDDHNHGTHCAGTVAAVGNNGIGVIGVGPKIKIMATKGLNSGGSGTSEMLANGLRWATDHGADVISNSWGPGGRSPSDPTCQAAIDYAYERGVVCVFAAGNSNDDVQYYFPANYERVIAVAATDSNDEKASFSNYGDLIEVCAPGVSVLSTVRNNGYDKYSGTSMACPHTAGVCGLLKSIRPGATFDEIRRIICEFSDDVGPPGKDNMGYGRVNAYLAVKGMAGNIKLEITSPADGSYIKGSVGIYGSAYSEGDFQKYEIYYAPTSNPEDLTLIISSTIPVEDGLLGTWNTTQSPEGEKRLILKLFTTDGRGFQRFTRVNVDNRNDPPTFAKMPDRKLAIIGRLLEFKVEASDPDDPTTPWGQLTYSADNLPPGAQFNPQTQIFSWTPSVNDKGTHAVTFIVRDSAFTITHTINLYSLYIQEVRITTEAIAQEYPDIHKGKVVWQGSGIHLHDLSTNQRLVITNSGKLPGIYDDKIVWVDGNFIYLYDLSTGQKRQVTDCGSQSALNLTVYKDKIVFEQGFPTGIYLYNLSTGQKIQLASGLLATNPAIYEDKIVWNERLSGIYLYDASTGKKEVIVPRLNFNTPIDPDIYENKVVFLWADIWNQSSGVYMYDLSTGKDVLISAFSGVKNPRISEDKIVWVGNGDIYMHDLPGEQQIQITINPSDQKDTTIDEDKIVWADNRNGNYDIYVANLFYSPVINSVSPTAVPRGGLLTITGNNFGSTQGDSKVLFANGAETQVESWSNTQITCRVPATAQTGLLKVVTLGGESNGVRVTIANSAPVLNPIGNKSVDEGVSLVFSISATDLDGDSLTYSASNLPQGANFNPGTRTFSWTPTYNQAGTYPNVHFAVTDGSLSDSEDITITVNNVSGPPVLDPIGNKSVNENTLLTFTVNATDPDGDALTYSASNLPQGASFDVGNRTFSWTPAYDQAGIYNNVHFEVFDGTATDSENITITVNNVNRAPILNAIGNKSIDEGQNLSFTVSGSDPDGDNLTYSASNLPQGASFNTTTKTFSWTPAYNQAGIYNNVHFEVSDGIATDFEDITITVNNVNRPPVLNAIGNKSIDEGQNLSFTVSGSDPDGDNLTYSASNLPQGASFNAGTRTFSWTPTYNQAGIYNNVHFEVSDGTATDSEDITITVNNVNRPPILNAIGNKSINEGQNLSFTVSGSDPDEDNLTYSASNLPQGASFNAGTRTFSWTPAYDQAGIYNNVHFEVSDGTATDSEDITITVNNVNRPPILNAIGNKSINEGQTLSFTVSGSDPDGDNLTYSASNLPQGANFNAGTRTFSWTPAYNQAGIYNNVHFEVSDGTGTDSEDITITVNNVNRPPVLNAIGNKSIDEGQTLSLTLSGSDPDGDNLTYSASNLPQGANFDSGTRTFTWTPAYDQAGIYHNVQFEVTDGSLSDSEDITVTVNNINRAPLLNSIGNKSITENQTLTFTVNATDPDGDTLTYSVQGLPDGATFKNQTFTWTPITSDVGDHQLTFIASDGSLSDSETIVITVKEEEKITLKIRFSTDRVSKIGILYISGETSEGAVIEEVKVLDDHNKILDIDMKDNVSITGERYITGIVIVGDIIKKYPLLGGIKIRIMVAKGEKTKEGETGLARIEPYAAGPDRIGVYNNVFNPLEGEKTIIKIDTTEQTHIKINLYDTRGKKIKEIADEERGAGICRYYWDGKDESGNVVGSGLYLVHIEIGDYKKTKKIVVVK